MHWRSSPEYEKTMHLPKKEEKLQGQIVIPVRIYNTKTCRLESHCVYSRYTSKCNNCFKVAIAGASKIESANGRLLFFNLLIFDSLLIQLGLFCERPVDPNLAGFFRDSPRFLLLSRPGKRPRTPAKRDYTIQAPSSYSNASGKLIPRFAFEAKQKRYRLAHGRFLLY